MENYLPTEISPRTFAVLSYDAYKNLSTTEMPGNWEVLTSSGAYNLGETGYTGIAYVNKKTNQIIIAHRGTDDFTNLNNKQNEKNTYKIF